MTEPEPGFSVGWAVSADSRVTGVVLRDGEPFFSCSHNHASTALAEECASRKLTELSNPA